MGFVASWLGPKNHTEIISVANVTECGCADWAIPENKEFKLECLVALCHALLHQQQQVHLHKSNPNLSLSCHKYRMGAAILDSHCPKRRKSEVLAGQLVSLVWCNLLNLAMLSWQGVGVVNSTHGGSCHGQTDRPLDRQHRKVTCKVAPCEQQGATKSRHCYKCLVGSA